MKEKIIEIISKHTPETTYVDGANAADEILALLDVVDSGDSINRKSLIQQIEKSKSYYEGIGRYDYSAGFDKARYMVATIGKPIFP